MKYTRNLRFSLMLCAAALTVGCGGGKSTTPVPPPVSPACAGSLLTGTMQDSLTAQPVAQGWAVLESATQLPSLPIYNFLPAQTVGADAKGAFSLCAPATLSQPSVLVLLGLDAAGKAYPAFVSNVTGPANLGTVNMGGCLLLCDIADGQQQSSAPAVITGTITSEPVSATGSLAALYTVTGLDGSKNLWNLAMPSLVPTQAGSFTTAAGTCPANAPFCASYAVTLPTQKPIMRTSTGSTQQAGPPTYTLYASPSATNACKPPFVLTPFQADGQIPLTATPGASLIADAITFGACQ